MGEFFLFESIQKPGESLDFLNNTHFLNDNKISNLPYTLNFINHWQKTLIIKSNSKKNIKNISLAFNLEINDLFKNEDKLSNKEKLRQFYKESKIKSATPTFDFTNLFKSTTPSFFSKLISARVPVAIKSNSLKSLFFSKSN
jgi:hypothetical protein